MDVMTFGSPCQDLSSMGKRAGLSGTRSSLFYEAIRIVNEMREATNNRYPAFLVWENVSRALISNDGMDFKSVLESVTGTAIPMPDSGGWATAGMVRGGSSDIAWRVLNAQHFGTAQRRRRIFLVADFGGHRAAEILFEQPRMLQNYALCGDGRVSATGSNRRYPDSPGRPIPETYPFMPRKMRKHAAEKDPYGFMQSGLRATRICPTLMTSGGQIVCLDYPESPDRNIARYLTPLEEERLMGLPEGWTERGAANEKISDTARYKAIGNSISLPVARFVLSRVAYELQKR